jgi:hypothetical protein
MTPETAKRVFNYDPETGILRWAIYNNKAYPGKIAGHPNSAGYLKVTYNYTSYQVPDVIWLIIYGKKPDGIIDHIDLDNSNNRLKNLRDATYSQNAANRMPDKRNKSGHVGVFYDTSRFKWLANIMKDGKTIHIGRYNSLEEAVEARRNKQQELFGEFAR